MASDAEKHIEQVARSEWHKQGGCVSRHDTNQESWCKYAENGYKATEGRRRRLYNAPFRFDAALADEVDQERRKTSAGKVVLSPLAPSAGSTSQQGGSHWNAGAQARAGCDNFKPRSMGGVGAHYPYLHNWHHLIPNQLLVEMLYDERLGYKLLEVLLAAKYNLNDQKNVVLLPNQARVAAVVKWPNHPNNHPTYDKYARKKLMSLKEKLAEALKDARHRIDRSNAGNVVKFLDSTSERLFKLLDALGRMLADPGNAALLATDGPFHVKRLQEFSARLETGLAGRT